MVNAHIADSGGSLLTRGFYFLIVGIKLSSDTVLYD